MPELIENLKLDHAELSELFRDIAILGVTSEEGQKKLLDAKAALLAHLKKEDDELYPVLWEMAKERDDLKHTLDLFADDMSNVTKTISAFFEKHVGGEHGTDFKEEFIEVYLILTKRINFEESTLFPEYR
ncbi:hemerythrin domain-containing protein [Verrucomicrobiota bacterium]